MNDKLKQLISEASANINQRESERDEALRKRDEEAAAKDREAFYNGLRQTLGPDVLASLGSFTYKDGFYSNAVHFSIDGHAFIIRQEGPGTLATFTESGKHVAQFQVAAAYNKESKDRFLTALGKALE